MNSALLCLLSLLLLSCNAIFNPKPTDTKWLDISGVMVVPHSKGWLVNTPSRRIVVTCTHSNPTFNTVVGFVDSNNENVYRKVVKTSRIAIQPYKKMELDLSVPLYENFYTIDITVCLIDTEAPMFASAYNIASSVNEKEWGYSINKRTEYDSFVIAKNKNNRVLSRKRFDILAEQGDSGLPWFNSQNEVFSHYTLAWGGYGPDYTDQVINAALIAAINELEQAATD